MSTPNFYCKNTSKIYAIESNEDYATIDCQSILEDSNWESCDEYDRECNNSYPASIIAEKTKSLYIGGTSIDITAKAKTVSGYYSGSCFDFDCEMTVYDMEGHEIAYYEELDDIYQLVDTAAIVSDNWTGNKGLSKIHAQRINEAMHQAINTLQEEAEKAFAASCDDELVCVCVFSNGEAIYKRA